MQLLEQLALLVFEPVQVALVRKAVFAVLNRSWKGTLLVVSQLSVITFNSCQPRARPSAFMLQVQNESVSGQLGGETRDLFVDTGNRQSMAGEHATCDLHLQ